MSRDLTMPEVLDEHGQRLWYAYRSAREREQCAEHTHRDAKRALRRHINHGNVLDPSISARFHAARDELDDARDERRVADMDYHAYRRMLMAQTISRPKFGSGSVRPDNDD